MSTQARRFLWLGGLLAALAVISGALGAHVLREVIVAGRRGMYETAVQYHFLHALGLLAVALAMERLDQTRLLRRAGWSMVTGVGLFSGSLYALALGAPGWLGAVTPLGGLAFIAGWLMVAVAAGRE